jgi:membrane-bound lytic murein transglycosylase B
MSRRNRGRRLAQGPAFLIVALVLGACASTPAVAPKTSGASAAPPASPAAPTVATGPAFDAWLAGLRQEAAAQGVSNPTLDAALNGLQPNQEIIDLEHKQPERTMTFVEYRSRVVSDQRVAKGQEMLAEYRPMLTKVAATYGVQPQYIVALWGVESDYGRYTGGYPVIGALATLAYGGERQDMFRKELIDALRILDEKDIKPEAMTGSWAGAMGQCQFMPSTFLGFAVDFDGSGRRDIWTDQADVFASIANYLQSLHWNAAQSWGWEVRLPAGFDENLIGLKVQKQAADWQALGIRDLDGSNLAAMDAPLSVIAPDGPSGPGYLVYPNFQVIMKWNRSTYFATTVGLLADRIAKVQTSALMGS